MQNIFDFKTDVEIGLKKNLHDKWSYFFQKTDVLEKKKKPNLVSTCQYLYTVPGHNANVEMIFSLIVSRWTKERNRFQVKTVESIIRCEFNFKMTCS